MEPAHDQEEAMAAADKEMEDRANRAKALLSNRYRGLRHEQVRESWNGNSFVRLDTNIVAVQCSVGFPNDQSLILHSLVPNHACSALSTYAL